ncbi:MAG TPA: heterodisulfide reductase-related iron-sulfur binding cluster, partial [Planctomycetia bacterium]|nr:heterodisulfide reductase-related iron-sulfur binding cluster [Planctomycetia bacterium]
VSSAPTTIPAPGVKTGVEYKYFLDCVHCGLCTSACPTYVELGTEMDGPRGRIHLMKAMTDGRIGMTPEAVNHLELCLDCRACETACPSGVQYGRLIEPFRVALEKHKVKAQGRNWFHRWILFPLFPYAGRMRLALWPARIAQKLGLDRFFLETLGIGKLLPPVLRQMTKMLPPLGPSLPALPERLPPKGPKRATVALLTGCVADAVFRATHWATARVLQENGCEVLVPRGQDCCGAIHYHAGEEGPAIERAIRNAQAIDADAVDAVIVNVAGCGAMLKDYHHLPIPAEHRERVTKFASKVRDISEFLAKLGPIKPTGPIPRRVAYHDACHLAHAQQIRVQPRELLALIPGLEVVPIADAELCCGAAGTYNLTQPEMAEKLAARKSNAVAEVNVDGLVTPNAGCMLHIGRKLREDGRKVWLAHPVELLDLSYRGLPPPG